MLGHMIHSTTFGSGLAMSQALGQHSLCAVSFNFHSLLIQQAIKPNTDSSTCLLRRSPLK